LHNPAQGKQQNAGFAIALQCGFEVFDGEARVLAELANQSLIV